MFDEILKGFGCGPCACPPSHPKKQSSSCDVLWIIILLMIIFKGGCFGLDLCTIIILLIVFGKDLWCKFRPAVPLM